MKLLEHEDRTVFFIATERLWEADDSALAFDLRRAGLAVKSVRKAMHEGRGRLRVELYSPSDPALIEDVLKERSVVVPKPQLEHFYRLEQSLDIQPSGNTYSMQPLTLAKGVILRIASSLPCGDLLFRVSSGEHESYTFALTLSEWAKASAIMTDMGEFIDGKLLDGRKPDKPSTKDSTAKPYEPSQYMRVGKNYPDFPSPLGPGRFMKSGGGK